MEEAPVTTFAELVAGFAPQVRKLGPGKPDLAATTTFLIRLGARAAFLYTLQLKDWFKFGKREDSLRALFESTHSSEGANSGPYLFHQLVNLAMTQGMTQRSPTGQKLMEQRVGNMPYLGPSLVDDAAGDAYAAPDAFVEQLLSLLDSGGPRIVLDSPVCSTDPECKRLALADRFVKSCQQPTVIDLASLEALPPESGTVEYKATFEWDSRRQARNPDLAQASLRAICAFLNSEGGVLTIGVTDDMEPIGLENDFSLLKDAKKEDTFEGRLRELMKNQIEPIPLNAVAVTFPIILGLTVCRISVSARPTVVTYLSGKDPKSGQVVDEVYVRDGNRSIALRGRRRDDFVLSRAR